MTDMGRAKFCVAVLLGILPWSASAQSARDADQLQPVISNLRACVRTNAPAARNAGVQTMNEATQFFSQQCSATLSNDLAKANPGAVPPGRFRAVIGEEWAEQKAEFDSK
jgi:hypothetical protein